MNLKVGRVCPQRAGLRMQNGSGALGTDAPYHYWVQAHNARVCSGNLSPRKGVEWAAHFPKNEWCRKKSWLNCGVFEVVCWLEFGRSLPPHPFPLSKGEGAHSTLSKNAC